MKWFETKLTQVSEVIFCLFYGVFFSLSSDFLMGVYCVRLDHRYSGEQLEKLDKKFPSA